MLLPTNKPLNEFARELIAAPRQHLWPACRNFYRALREPSVRGEAAAQVFFGIRLQCAKCHNHPFDRWTQIDYHAWTAFFAARAIPHRGEQPARPTGLARIRRRTDRLAGPFERMARSATPRGRPAPQFLGETTPAFGKEDDRLLALADWVAKPDNPFFARAQANRVWYHLMGRGLVEPNDDFRASNPPANRSFARSSGPGIGREPFRSASPDPHDHDFDHLPALGPTQHNQPRRRNQFFPCLGPFVAGGSPARCVGQASGASVHFRGLPAGMRATQLSGVRSKGDSRPGPADQFLQRFGKPERLLSCDCERSDDVTLSQAFQLITGETVNKAANLAGKRLSDLLHEGRPASKLVDECYLAALCRYPTSRTGSDRIHFARKGKQCEAFEDLLAALLSSKEFLLRH